jgi:tetratricopeptide (TPR) repeat protein
VPRRDERTGYQDAAPRNDRGPRRDDRNGPRREERGGRGRTDRERGGRGTGRQDEEKVGPRKDDPIIPAGITGAELDRGVKAELRSLPRTLADLVAQHLVASGRFLEDDPELAYQHAKTARRLAARLGGVREAVAVTAYLSEHYAEALTEFRAVRRMTGNHEVLPAMADCERALGHPEKALALSQEKVVMTLEEGSQIEMLIVAAGARRDMGQTAAAIQVLEIPELTKRTRAEWLPRLRYAYADALAEAGRTEEALTWFHRAAGSDQDGSTGAAERAAELEGLTFTDLDEDDEDVIIEVVDDHTDNSADADDADLESDADDEDDEDDDLESDADENDDVDSGEDDDLDADDEDDSESDDSDTDDAVDDLGSDVDENDVDSDDCDDDSDEDDADDAEGAGAAGDEAADDEVDGGKAGGKSAE